MYILLEMQTTDNKTSLVPVKTFNDRFTAENAYHNALAAAAISKVPIHAVALLDEHGNTIRKEYYEHISAANMTGSGD